MLEGVPVGGGSVFWGSKDSIKLQTPPSLAERVPPPLTVEEEFLLLLDKIWME